MRVFLYGDDFLNELGKKMWIDQPSAQLEIDKIPNQTIRDAVTELRKFGFTVIKGAVNTQDCDELVLDFHKFCNDHPAEVASAMLKEGHCSRLYNIHSISNAAMRVALNPIALQVMDIIFSNRAALNSTLFFQQGSQQETHRDTPFFYAPEFPGEFVGVWFALEDVNIDAGPLHYFPGGHRLKVDIEMARTHGGHNPENIQEIFKHYCKQVKDAVQHAGLKEEKLIINKGDLAIWHPELPHGGSSINRTGISRLSMVGHYMPEGAYIQTVGNFFKIEEPQKIMEFCNATPDRKMRWNEPPKFMPNN